MNAILYQKGSNEIVYFVKDCVKHGNDFIGSNMKLYGCKSFEVLWTEDEEVKGQKLNKIKSSVSKTERRSINVQEYQASVKIIQLLDDITFTNLEKHIDTSITDLETAKSFIKLMAATLKAVIEIQNYDSKKGK